MEDPKKLQEDVKLVVEHLNSAIQVMREDHPNLSIQALMTGTAILGWALASASEMTKLGWVALQSQILDLVDLDV